MRKPNITDPQGSGQAAAMAPHFDPPVNGEFSGNESSVITSTHDQPKSVHYDKALLSWDQSVKYKIKRLSINKILIQWMDYDPAFANWIRTCVACHVHSGADETPCPVPDRWIGEVGDQVTIVSSGCIPGKRGPEVCEGAFNVMLG